MTTSRALLIHGWNVSDPTRTIGRLSDPLRDLGYDPLLLRYGHVFWPKQTSFRTRLAAKQWVVNTRPGDVVIGHSNGCALAWEMSHCDGNLADTMVWINPALDPPIVPGRSVRRCLVVYNSFDDAVPWARFVPDSVWGDMGRRGYVPDEESPFGRDPRMEEVTHGRGHSDWSDPAGLALLIHRFVSKEEAA